MPSWFVIGISGVTGGGKSTLAQKLHSLYPNSQYLCLDHFFLPKTDPRHRIAPELNKKNWDGLWAIDTEKWKQTIQQILRADPEDLENGRTNGNDMISPVELTPTVPVPKLNGNLLILDGFVALNDPWTASQCQLKFYFTLTREQCWERRQQRFFSNPDIPGYFETCVWPGHVTMKAEVIEANPDLILVDGTKPWEESLDMMLQHMAFCLE